MGCRPGLGQVLERGQHAPVDLAGADVVAAARRRPRCARRRARASRAAASAAAGSGRSTSRPRRRRRGRCGPRRGRSRWPRAASSRRGSASGRSAARPCRPGGSRSPGARALPASVRADAAEHRAADHARALAQPAQPDLLGVEAERAREVVACRSRSRPACAPSASSSCSRPPASRAPGMSGWANRRSLTGTLACGARGRSAASRGRLAVVEASGWRPAEAGAVGLGSSASPLAFSAVARRARGRPASSLGTG